MLSVIARSMKAREKSKTAVRREGRIVCDNNNRTHRIINRSAKGYATCTIRASIVSLACSSVGPNRKYQLKVIIVIIIIKLSKNIRKRVDLARGLVGSKRRHRIKNR